MYGVGFRYGDDPIQCAQAQLDDIRAKRPGCSIYALHGQRMAEEGRDVVYCNHESPSCMTK